MRSLLDVNVLIALFDSDHTAHRTALSWFSTNAAEGWASCPITQNGCLRVMSNTRYPGHKPVMEVALRLGELCANPVHEFWPDDVTLTDPRHVEIARIHGPAQLTDVYLLALAVAHHGRLVTFDDAIARSAVHGAGPQNLLVL